MTRNRLRGTPRHCARRSTTHALREPVHALTRPRPHAHTRAMAVVVLVTTSASRAREGRDVVLACVISISTASPHTQSAKVVALTIATRPNILQAITVFLLLRHLLPRFLRAVGHDAGVVDQVVARAIGT